MGENVEDSYIKTTSGEVSRGFFRRNSTQRYIETLASLDDVTIYAGAGVSADVGAPLSNEMMPLILSQWITEHPDFTTIDEENRSKVDKRISKAIGQAYPPAYLGSIAREIARLQRPEASPEKTGRFISQIEVANRAGYTSGGFLARSVGALAFALKSEGNSVEIITTNYDRTIIEERPKVLEYFRDVTSDCDYEFEARTSASDDPVGPDEIPIFHVNGVASEDSAGPLVIGEVDFFAWYDHNQKQHQVEHQQWRDERLDDALSKGTCIFVGSSLTDPDVLAKLAVTKFQQPRYAVLLAPDQENEPDGSALLELGEEGSLQVDPIERAIVRDIVAKRFLHLGVIPIMVDFPHQVPQLLTEIALRVKLGDEYEGYSDRLAGWWGHWAKLFGFADERTPGFRNVPLQAHWAHRLASIREDVCELLELTEPSAEEKIMVEVWVRNPKTRTLFLWATSEGIWLNGNSALWCDLGESETRFGAQRCFRKGRTHGAEILPKRGLWEYGLSVPLTLHDEPWRHLPVGVVNVRSSKLEGELSKAVEIYENLEKLEKLLVKPANDLLDPGKLDPKDPHWSWRFPLPTED